MILKACLYLIMFLWQRQIRQLNYQKLTFVLLTCSLPFLVTKGSSVLEKKVNGAQVSNTVFSHLNSACHLVSHFTKPPKLFGLWKVSREIIKRTGLQYTVSFKKRRTKLKQKETKGKINITSIP